MSIVNKENKCPICEEECEECNCEKLEKLAD